MRVYRCISIGLKALLLCMTAAQASAAALGSKGLTREDVLGSNENYAIILGVDEYDALGNLNYAAADAKAMAQVFEEQGYDVRLLINDQVRRQRVNQTIDDVVELAGGIDGGNGSVVFAFSGHGFRSGGENYLALVDTRPDAITDTGFSLDSVKSRLAQARVRQRVMIIDACRDDPFAPSKGGAGGRANFVLDDEAEGLAVLYSTGADRQSWEDSDLGQGVFTHFVLKGLRGAAAGPDGLVSFNDLYAYVRDRVKQHVKTRFRKVQIPYIGGERTGEFVLARATVPADTNTAATQEPVGASGQSAKAYIEPEMASLPAGEYQMGCDGVSCQADEQPTRRVQVGAFQLAKREVTRAEFALFVKESGYRTEAERQVAKSGCRIWDNEWQWRGAYSWRTPGFPQDDQHPVVCVSWNDAQAYIEWLNSQSNKRYRLPTEAEWEYAARGDGSAAKGAISAAETCSLYNLADTSVLALLPGVGAAPCNDEAQFTAAGGQYAAGSYGLQDMGGNVWEWVEDHYGDYQNAPSDGSAQVTGRGRVLRGGGWYSTAPRLRPSNRYWSDPRHRDFGTGFRLAAGPGS